MEDKKVLLSIKDLYVKFHFRGRILTAIRGISLDIYENESIAIVGESGSGKSVFTKTFAGMLDSNGFIDNGSIIFYDDELSKTNAVLDDKAKQKIADFKTKLDSYSKLEAGKDIYLEIEKINNEIANYGHISDEEQAAFDKRIADTTHDLTELQNYRQTLAKNEKDEIKPTELKIKELEKELKSIQKEIEAAKKAAKARSKGDSQFVKERNARIAELNAEYAKVTDVAVTPEQEERNLRLAKEI